MKKNISNISGTTEQVFTVNGNSVITATDTILADADEHIGITAGDPHGFIAYLGFTPSNALSDMTESSDAMFVSDTEKNTWNGKQDALNYTLVPDTRLINGYDLTADISLGYSDVSAAPILHTHGGLIHDNRVDLDLVSGTNTGDETQTTIRNKLGIASETASGYLTSEGYAGFLNRTEGYLLSLSDYQVNTRYATATQGGNLSDSDFSNIQYHIGITQGDPHGYTGGNLLSLRIGSVSSGHYSEFLSDGTLKFIGNATIFEDLNFDPDSSGGAANTLPDYILINNCVYREFTSANNQICGSCKELPHAYKLSSMLYPHLHLFLKTGESAGTTGVEFTIYWELRQTTGVTNGSTVLSATSAGLGQSFYRLTVNDTIGFAGAAEIGAQLSLTLKRTGGNAGDVIVTTYGVHYGIDTIGSREITVKY